MLRILRPNQIATAAKQLGARRLNEKPSGSCTSQTGPSLKTPSEMAFNLRANAVRVMSSQFIGRVGHTISTKEHNRVLESSTKARIVDRMSMIEYHVAGRAGNGLLDATAGLEVLYREVLNLTRGWQLTSANVPKRNFEAIDLQDENRGIAVQVTVDVNSTKIKQTRKMFATHDLQRKFTSLIFVGIRGVKSSAYLVEGVEVYLQKELLNLDNLSLESLEKLEARLAHSAPWRDYSNLSDKSCFDVVVGVLDRDALRRHVYNEGNFTDFLQAMTDVKQIINQGVLGNSLLSAKPLVEYGPSYRHMLEGIESAASEMRNLVQRNRINDLQIADNASRLVENIRLRLVNEVNVFCASQKIERRIRADGCWL